METLSDPLPQRNMRVGLIIFGSFSIALGALCLLLIPLMFLGSLIHVKGHEPTPFSMLVPSALFYLLIGVIDIWLGIGSVQCKRWARNLLLLWSSFWLFCGVLGLLCVSLMFGEMNLALTQSGSEVSPTFAASFKIGMLIFMVLFYIILPGSFTWFYLLRDTRLTCEERNPNPDWTDRCPLPVMGLALLAGLTALCFPLMLIYGPVFPFFGFYLQGAPAYLVILILSAIFAWVSWGMYHLKSAAWATYLGVMFFFLLSYMVTFSQGGLIEMYHRMNIPAQTMRVLEASPLLKSHWLGWISLLYAIPFVGAMLYVRKYFVKKTPVD